MEDDLWELKNTKLPRHHRDAEEAMRWAAAEIERLRHALSAIEAGVPPMPSEFAREVLRLS